MLLASAGGAYVYVTDLQKTSEIHRLNAEKFEQAAKTNEEALRVQKENYLAMAKNLEVVNKEFAATRAQNTVLADKLAKPSILPISCSVKSNKSISIVFCSKRFESPLPSWATPKPAKNLQSSISALRARSSSFLKFFDCVSPKPAF